MRCWPAGSIGLLGPPIAYAVFAHWFTCSKDIFAAGRIAAELNAHGIAVLRFDFTGLASSEGDFSNTNFTSNVEDLVCAADWLREHHAAPQILIGHSLGGAAVLEAARLVPSVVAGGDAVLASVGDADGEQDDFLLGGGESERKASYSAGETERTGALEVLADELSRTVRAELSGDLPLLVS